MEERHVEENRNDYTRFDQYNEEHPDALATGDSQGKGTGTNPDGYTKPYFSPTQQPIDYTRFDTENRPSRVENKTNPGNGTDNTAREDMLRRNKYGQQSQYCPSGKFDQYAIYEGQFWSYDKPLNDRPASQIPAETSVDASISGSSNQGHRDNIGPTIM